MGIQCRIIRDKQGKVAYVEAPNGNRSKLYDDAVSRVGEDSALDIVLTAYTPSFTEEVKNPMRDAFRRQLIDRINTLPSTAKTVTLNLEDIQQTLDLTTLEMTSEDLGNGETLLSFSAEAIDTAGQRLAPNGQPSNLNERQYAEVRTPEFMEWSNNWEDVIKDENGEPQVHYHGTVEDRFTEFNSGNGIEFFTPLRKIAETYAGFEVGNPDSMYQVYVKSPQTFNPKQGIPEGVRKGIDKNWKAIKNETSYLVRTKKAEVLEKIYDILENQEYSWEIMETPTFMQILKDNGYTGIQTAEQGGKNIGIFNNKNVKSAEENVGTFDGTTSDIRYSEGATSRTPEEALQNLADRLTQSGLAKEVNLVSETEIKEALEQQGQKYRQGINGFVIGDSIYINKDRAGLDTPIHEFGHLWNSWMQENAPEVFNKGIALIEKEGQKYIDFVKETQPDLEGNDLLEEALAQAIGDSGAKLAGATKNSFTEWLNELWESLKGALGLANTSLEEFQNLTLGEFTERAATDLLSGNSLEELMNSQAGSVGSAFTIKPNAPLAPSKSIDRFAYDSELTTQLPRKTLNEVIEEYEGRVFIVTSDATGVGYDSKGDPIYGGVGFMAIKENVNGQIGFASLDKATVKKTLPKISGRYGKNKKVAVLVMVQNADATVGNYYGAKYFGRGLRKLKEQSPEMYDAVVDSIEEYINTRKGVRQEFKDKYTNGELVKKGTFDAFIQLLRDVDKYSEVAFAEEFIKDTTFDARRTLLQGLIIANQETRTDSSTPLVKQALKDIGFDQMTYLKEYGDNTIFTEEMYAENAGGFVVGGFEYVTPNSEAELNDLINNADTRGIRHPQFNGKIPTTGENFYLDGLYPVNDNFSQYAKKQTTINNEAISKEEVDALVRKTYKKDVNYLPKYREGGNEYIPMNKRGYTHLSVPNKTALKTLLSELNPNNLNEKTPNVAVNVAKGIGFYPETESSRKDLVRKVGDFARFSISENEAQALTNTYLGRATTLKESDPNQYWSVDIPSREVVLDAARNGRLVDVNGGMGIVKEDGDMVGLFKYDKSAKGTAASVQAARIKLGGIKLDNFDGYLTKLYEKNGFRVVARMAFNEEYAPEGWNKEAHGTPDVVAMVYDPKGELDFEERTFEDYDEMLAYRDSLIPERLSENKTGQTQGFFSDVVTGKSDKFKAKRAWSPILPYSRLEQKFNEVYDKFKGNFDNHIATSIPTFRETQVKVGSAIRSMLAPAPTSFNEALMNVRDKYVADKNLEKKEPVYTAIDDSLFTEIAEHHAKVKDDRQNPTMVKSYRAFLNETKQQYQYLIDAGYTIEPWMGEGEPYGVDSNAVREDVINNKHLYYLRSKSATGDNNDADTAENYMPFESSGITINGDDVLMNDLFRAVHDIFGHVSASNSFSPQGELNAYKTHAVMYSKQAQKALFLETVVYNAAYRETGNYAPRKIYNIPNKFIEGINRKPLVYDIGGSEGGFVKAITEQSNGAVESINLDLNSDMQAAHNKKPVEGSEFVLEAFYEGYTDEETGVTYKRHKPKRKADVVHESMVFQFIAPERKQFVKEVKDNYLREDGIALFEEKLSTYQEDVWLANEKKKNEYKSMYYSQEEIAQKSDEVLVGMKKNQTYREEFLKTLREEFDFVEEYWDAGNFKGYLATNSREKRDKFLAKLGGRIISEYSENKTKPRFSVGFVQTKRKPEGEQVILSNVDDQIQGNGIGTEMYKQAATQAVQNGTSLVSDFNNKGAAGIWSKFREQGLTEPVDVNGQVVERIKITPDSFDTNGEPNVSDVITYIQSKNYEGVTLSEAEKTEVANAMIGTEMTSSEELYRAMKRAFTPQGIYNPSEESLVASGLYSRVEARRLLDSEDIQLAAYEMMHKIKNSDAVANEADIDNSYVTITSAYNTLGTLKKANPYINKKNAREILGGIKDETLFYNQTEANDLEFANKKFDELSKLTKVRRVKIVGESVRPETNLDDLRIKMEETLTLPSETKLVKNLEYLLTVPNDVWNLEFSNVKTILTELESNAVDIGLDLSNLNEESYDKTPAEVKSLLNAVRNFAVLQNESTFEILLDEYVTFFDLSENQKSATLDISEATADKTLVYSETDVDSYTLFSKFGLLPLGNNLYQKVNTNKSVEEATDIIYETVAGGNNIIPKSAFKTEYDIADPANEEFVKQDITNYVNEQAKEIDSSGDYDTDTLRKMVLFSKYFNTRLNNTVSTPSIIEEMDVIANYPSNAEYLKTEFISDFNKKMLKEKVKNSEKWNNFYKHFDITSKGIELLNTDPITMREIQPYLTTDLVNHFRLKKNGVRLDTELVIPMEVTNSAVLLNYYSNYPKALPLFKGSYQMDNDVLVTNVQDDFLRVNEGLFAFVETVGNKSLYSKLNTNNTDFKTYSKTITTPQIGEISKFNISAGVKADKKVNHLYNSKEDTEITNEIDNC